MDYTTDEYHHYQQQYCNQYHHQQQQQQQEATATYDQSMTTTTTTTQQSYPYNNQEQQQQQYSYYSTSSYLQQQFYQEPTSIHPPGVPIQPGPTPVSGHEHTHLRSQQIACYSPAVVENHSQAHLNPVDRNPPIGQFAYRGGGRKGGRPFRGGRRGYLGYQGPRPDGPAFSVCGRGRGKGASGHIPSHVATPNSALVPAEGVASSMMPTSVSALGEAPFPVPAQVHAPFWPPPCLAWCELCRVDCNTPEILEQHKKGKRHKKNLQIHEELQNLNKIITRQQNVQDPTSELKLGVQFEKDEISEEKQLQLASLPSEAVPDLKNETVQDRVENSGTSSMNSTEGTKRKSMDHFEAKGGGSERKMRGTRGRKYMRINEGLRRPVEPPKPKEVIHYICELCNVKCESQVVLDSHLAGKKHQSNLKRFHSHRALYGDVGLQALYPTNANAPSSSLIPQVQQLNNDPQVVLAQLLNYVLTQAPAPSLEPSQVAGHLVTQASASAPGLSAECQHPHISQAQESQAITEADINSSLTVESELLQQSKTTEFQDPQKASIDTKAENDTFVSETKEVSVPQDNSK
ncbi:zf-met domain-containing protein [Cephalotus follicularis]|uniref:Zf-met domain-containing protein n=1 Tax=Cephalotus follicularis TaxID=3775 RepID=A0A1Q3B1Z8_CEPFO|nr:zf-met domain-containing protein [Cephalotus follicularis]